MLIESIKWNDEKAYQKGVMKFNLLESGIQSDEVKIQNYDFSNIKLLDYKSNLNEIVLTEENIKIEMTIGIDKSKYESSYYIKFLEDQYIPNHKLKIELATFYDIESLLFFHHKDSESMVLNITRTDWSYRRDGIKPVLNVYIKTKPCKFIEIINLKITLKPTRKFVNS